MILAAGYMLWMFKRVFYGEVTNPKNEGLPDLSRREAFILVPLVALALLMGVASPLFTKRIEPAADRPGDAGAGEDATGGHRRRGAGAGPAGRGRPEAEEARR